MASCKLSHAAEKDIEDILDYSISTFDLAQTEQYYTQLTQCLKLLADNPTMGVDASEIRHSYRRFAHQSHIVFYTTDASGILVIRILHKHMDAVRHMQE
jgi:toxin ParE1/3/4